MTAPVIDPIPPITTIANSASENSGREAVEAQRLLVVGVQPAGERGEEAGDRERGELRAHRTDAERLRLHLVVAKRDEVPSRACPPQVPSRRAP